jgi:hypothetical protein
MTMLVIMTFLAVEDDNHKVSRFLFFIANAMYGEGRTC